MLTLVNQSVTLFRPSTQKKKLSVEVFSDGNDLCAFADIDMVRAILRNLLSNAIKYSFPEGQIDILVKELPDAIKVSIKDYGVGIHKEQLQLLLDENQPTLTSPGTQNEKGSGLGLVLIKDFVAKNKGTFGIESEKGKGSTFWFSLPRQKEK
jgi:signal transduction histidine kinase